MQRKQFLINLCQSSWKRVTESGWIFKSLVNYFSPDDHQTLIIPSFWKACCEGSCDRVFSLSQAPMRSTQHLRWEHWAPCTAKICGCFVGIWAKVVSGTHSFSRRCNIFKLSTEKPPNTTLGVIPEGIVSCLFSRLASKRKQFPNPDKTQSSQGWPPDYSGTKESPRAGRVTCTCSCRCSPGLTGQTQGSPCAHQWQTTGLLPWNTGPRPRSCQPAGPVAAGAAPPVREPEHIDVKCTGCLYIGNSETRAEQTPGSSFMCYHSKKRGRLGRNARQYTGCVTKFEMQVNNT